MHHYSQVCSGCIVAVYFYLLVFSELSSPMKVSTFHLSCLLRCRSRCASLTNRCLHTIHKARAPLSPSIKLLSHAKCCMRMYGGWEVGLPWLLLEARWIVQESTWFANDIVLCCRTAGQKKQPPKNLVDFVNCFPYKLHKAQEAARQNLSVCTGKLKKIV